MNHGPPHTLEDYKAERRRQRWGYFLTPFIALASIVVSVGMLMFMAKACQERMPADSTYRMTPFQKRAPIQDQDNSAPGSGREGPGAGDTRPMTQEQKSQGK